VKVTLTVTGFSKLDLDEAKRIARMVEFDVTVYARELGRGCGPGKDYFAQDRRYFMVLLLRHLEGMVEKGLHLAPDVRDWFESAKEAAREHREIEEHHSLQRRRNR